MLTELLEQLNKNLPANVYVPITHDNIITSKFQRKSSKAHHKVLQICTDYNFCLHSKERVPYHIIIEIEMENQPQPNESSATNSEEDYSHHSNTEALDSRLVVEKSLKTCISMN